MNVSSSTSATTSTSSAASTASASKAQNNSSTSFDEELKNVETAENTEQEAQQKADTKTENKDTSDKKQQDEQADNLLTGKVEVDADVDAQLNSTDLLAMNIRQLLDTQNLMNNRVASISTSEDLSKNIGETLNFQSMEMTIDDAQFFVDVVKNNNAGVQNVVQDIQQAMNFGTESVQKSANVSKTLLNALQNSVKTGQAVRIDFGNDVAVVMRVSRDGSIMANFIPGDKAVEEYLKNNIGFLKQRFDEEDIPYSQLSYSQHQQQERRGQQENNKENKHE